MQKKIRKGFKYFLLGFMTFVFTTCFIIFKENYELNKTNKKCLALIDQIDEYKIMITQLEMLDNEEMSQQDRIDALNEKIDSLNEEIGEYKEKISYLNNRIGNK